MFNTGPENKFAEEHKELRAICHRMTQKIFRSVVMQDHRDGSLMVYEDYADYPIEEKICAAIYELDPLQNRNQLTKKVWEHCAELGRWHWDVLVRRYAPRKMRD